MSIGWKNNSLIMNCIDVNISITISLINIIAQYENVGQLNKCCTHVTQYIDHLHFEPYVNAINEYNTFQNVTCIIFFFIDLS